jgi:hypothetical protein
VFPIVQPFDKMGIGFDNLPPLLRTSTVLTGHDLAELASLEQLPAPEVVLDMSQRVQADEWRHTLPPEDAITQVHRLVKEYITKGQIQEALALALVPDYLWKQ